jgi:hypothetical protein
MTKKIITKVFNLKNRPGIIIKFQWKDNVVKSICTDDMKVTTDKNIDEETFIKTMEEFENDKDLVGPHPPGSLVQRCVPKIKW